MTTDRATELMRNFRGKRVAVLGDLILDRYLRGRAERISPEAPVPVVRVHEKHDELGGAANVLRNLAALGANPMAFGLLGNDSDGKQMMDLMRAQNIDVRGVLRDPTRQTTVKTRILADNQQVVRIDEENPSPLAPAYSQQLQTALNNALPEIDALIVEDYNKGVITHELTRNIAQDCRRHRCILAWDPHPGNPIAVKDLTLFTPNRLEAFALAGMYYRPTTLPLPHDDALCQVGKALQQKWAPEALLITLGSDGMALFANPHPPFHVPTVAREVYDVSGAGDTVISSCVLAMLANADIREAAIFANHAAGVVVRHVGTVPVNITELKESFIASV